MTKRDLLDALREVPDDMRVVPIVYDSEGLPVALHSVKPAIIGRSVSGEKMANVEFLRGIREGCRT